MTYADTDIKRPANDHTVPHPLTSDGDQPPAYYVETLPGTAKVAAARRVWGPRSKVALGLGVALVAYIYSLDGTTTYQYLAFATSFFGQHSLLATIQVAQAIILAVTKPPAAKIADLFGRAEAYITFVVLYVLGYIVIASAQDINAYAGGAVLYSFGSAGIQILQIIVISDLTSLRWRSLMSSLVSLPFFINAFVSSNIAQQVLARSGWRWGYGMFCIIIPVATLPIVVTLLWAQRRAKKLGVVATDYQSSQMSTVQRDTRSFAVRMKDIANGLDLLGLFFFAAAWSLILIPLTLVNHGTSSWHSGHIIAMIVLGCVGLVGFGFYEAKYARVPIIPLRFIKNKTVVAAWVINFFDFVSFYLQFTYQYSFMYITHPTWSVKELGYFGYTQTLSLTFFAILSGAISLYTRRLKWQIVAGTLIRLFGVGLMIHSKGAHGSTAELVIVQIIQGAGGGVAAALTQTAAQASMPHQDLATVTAATLLFAEIGNAIGTAIAGSIWSNVMPGQLEKHLTPLGVNSTSIAQIFGSISIAGTYPEGSPIKKGIVDAYTHTMTILLIPATVLAIIPVIAALFIDNIKLGDTQNAVEGPEGDVPLPAGEADYHPDHSDDKHSA